MCAEMLKIPKCKIIGMLQGNCAIFLLPFTSNVSTFAVNFFFFRVEFARLFRDSMKVLYISMKYLTSTFV